MGALLEGYKTTFLSHRQHLFSITVNKVYYAFPSFLQKVVLLLDLQFLLILICTSINIFSNFDHITMITNKDISMYWVQFWANEESPEEGYNDDEGIGASVTESQNVRGWKGTLWVM